MPSHTQPTGARHAARPDLDGYKWKLGSGSLRAGQKVLGDDFAGSVLAAATATTDRQLALNFEQRSGAVIDGIADLTITHGVADAHVHVGPYAHSRPPKAARWTI